MQQCAYVCVPVSALARTHTPSWGGGWVCVSVCGGVPPLFSRLLITTAATSPHNYVYTVNIVLIIPMTRLPVLMKTLDFLWSSSMKGSTTTKNSSCLICQGLKGRDSSLQKVLLHRCTIINNHIIIINHIYTYTACVHAFMMRQTEAAAALTFAVSSLGHWWHTPICNESSGLQLTPSPPFFYWTVFWVFFTLKMYINSSFSYSDFSISLYHLLSKIDLCLSVSNLQVSLLIRATINSGIQYLLIAGDILYFYTFIIYVINIFILWYYMISTNKILSFSKGYWFLKI